MHRKLNNREFVFSKLEYMKENNLFTDKVLEILQDKDKCIEMFKHYSKAGILMVVDPDMDIEDQRRDAKFYSRYYSKLFELNGKKYLVSKEWKSNMLELFDKWVSELASKRENGKKKPIYLSKSRYCNGVQCPKMLWLRRNKPEEFNEAVMNDVVLKNGIAVGDLARGIFGPYKLVEYDKNLNKMVEETRQLITDGEKIIAEASFFTDGLFCSVDILKNLGDNKVELYEVKSSTDIKDIYYHDVAFQCYVLRKVGYKVVNANIIHVNGNYVRHGELSLNEFFNIVNVTDQIKGIIQQIPKTLSILRNYASQEEEPLMDIGLHCISPYNCGFFGYCGRNIPYPSVFDISRFTFKQKFEYYDAGIITFSDVFDKCRLTESQKLQVEHEVNDRPAHIEKDGIIEILKQLTFPLYFLDFETFQPAIPAYENSKPYEQIVFQYSLHYIEHDGGELKHKEYLAYSGEDPRRKLAERLCQDIPRDVCVTAYNMGFEKRCIKGLAENYPDLADHLMNIHDNIHDLMTPFQKKMYYTKEMEGSYSIKYVLPALFPDDPDLDYSNLEDVHNGSEASGAFSMMSTMDEEEMERYRQNLLKYCGLDTFAMVKIWEKLNEVVGNKIEVTW